MKHTEKCKCGKASMSYEEAGEDMWICHAVNTQLVYNDNWGKDCICKSCGDHYDSFDPCMVDVIEN